MTEFDQNSSEWETEFIATPPVLSVLAGFTGLVNLPEGSTIASIIAIADRTRVERNLEVLHWSR